MVAREEGQTSDSPMGQTTSGWSGRSSARKPFTPLPPDGALFIMARLSVDRSLPFAPTGQAQRWKRALTEGIDIDGMHTRFHYWTGGAQRLKRVAIRRKCLLGARSPNRARRSGRGSCGPSGR